MKIYSNGQSMDIFGVFPRGPAGPDGNPIGTIISYMGMTAPKDYLICDGTAYNVADYPHLAAFFQRQFGNVGYFGGNGETTFAVPDMRNLFLRGYHGEAEEQLSGEIGVRQEGTEYPELFGQIATRGSYNVISNFNGRYQNKFTKAEAKNKDSSKMTTTFYQAITPDSSSFDQYTDFTPASVSYTSRPINMAVLYCIKAVESISAENVYSTEETRIGIWMDKPLYQKSIQYIFPDTASDDDVKITKVCSEIDTIVFSYFNVLSAAQNCINLPYSSGAVNASAFVKKSDGFLYAFNKILGLANRPAIATLKYTKAEI